MSKTTIESGSPNGAVKIRMVTGSPAAADNTTINDAHFPPDDALSTAGSKSVLLFCRFDGGTNPTAQLHILHRAGAGWAVGTTSVTLSDGEAVWIETMGRDIYPRLAAVSGDPTQIDIYAAGWESYRYDGPRA